MQYILIAVNSATHYASIWTPDGWEYLGERTLPVTSKAKAMEMGEAIAVRDAARLHNVGKTQNFHLLPLAE